MSDMTREHESTSVTGTLKAQFSILVFWAALAWGLEAVDQFFLKERLDNYGIRPLELDGLWGILCAPLLHGGFAHLTANTVPFLVLGWFVLAGRKGDFFLVNAIVVILGGLGVWLTGNWLTDHEKSIHFGASGVIFGYLGFLLFRGVFERSIRSIFVALLAGGLYGGLVFGLVPGKQGVSWQGHLFGFVAGAVTAKLLAASNLRLQLEQER